MWLHLGWIIKHSDWRCITDPLEPLCYKEAWVVQGQTGHQELWKPWAEPASRQYYVFNLWCIMDGRKRGPVENVQSAPDPDLGPADRA